MRHAHGQEFGAEEAGGDRGAIDDTERLASARTACVNCFSGLTLASAGLASEKNGDFAKSRLL
jgi:hypothetical protein